MGISDEGKSTSKDSGSITAGTVFLWLGVFALGVASLLPVWPVLLIVAILVVVPILAQEPWRNRAELVSSDQGSESIAEAGGGEADPGESLPVDRTSGVILKEDRSSESDLARTG